MTPVSDTMATFSASFTEALNVVTYEFFVLITLFGSWIVWRSLSKRRPAQRLKAKSVWDPPGSPKTGSGEESSVKDAKMTTREAERAAARIMAMATDQYTKALRMYRDMVRNRSDREIRDERFYFALIQASIRVGNADVAGQMLKDMKRNNVSPSLSFLQSVLKLFASKQFFAQCLLVREVFGDALPVDKTICSCLAFAATEYNNTEVAMAVFEQMRASPDIDLSAKDYVNFFRVFAKRQDPDAAMRLLTQLKEKAVPLETILINIVLATLVAAGQLKTGQEVLDAVKRGDYGSVAPDVVTFNTILKGYAQALNVDQCFKMIEEMLELQVVPDDVTYGILLDACIADNDLNKANEVLDRLIKSGMPMNTVLYTTFIKGFVRAQMLDRAMQLYETMKAGQQEEQGKTAKPDLITYSILIKAHADKRNMNEALTLLDDMQAAGYRPDDIVVNHLLEGCCHVSNIDLGEKLFKSMVTSGKTKPSIYTIATMVKLYGKTGRCEEAIALVESMEDRYKLKPSVVIYTCLMSGCVRNKKYDRAIDVFRQMKSHGLTPDKMTYTTVVDASRQGSKYDQAYELCEEASQQRIELGVDTQNNLLAQMIAKSQVATARKLYKLMSKHGVHCTVPNVERRLKLTEERSE